MAEVRQGGHRPPIAGEGVPRSIGEMLGELMDIVIRTTCTAIDGNELHERLVSSSGASFKGHSDDTRPSGTGTTFP